MIIQTNNEEKHHMTRRLLLGMLFAGLFLAPPLATSAEKQPAGLAIRNGWYAHNGKAEIGRAHV